MKTAKYNKQLSDKAYGKSLVTTIEQQNSRES